MRVKLVLSLTLLMTMAAAAPARAGIFDIIWEMSGPQLFGIGAFCEIGRDVDGPHCFFPVPNKRGLLSKKTWLMVEPTLYFATGRGDWETGSVMMFAIDPMIAVSLKKRDDGKHRLYAAAGASFDYFAGANAEDFGRVALKLRPLTYEFHPEKGILNRFLFSYTVRYYNGVAVTDTQSGHPILKKGSGSEWVHGPTFMFLF
jgi:hypothetical protein